MKHFAEMVMKSVDKVVTEAEDEEVLDVEVSSDEEGSVDPDAEMTEPGDSEDDSSDEGDDEAKVAIMANLKKSTDDLDDFVMDEGIDDVAYEKLLDLIKSLLNETSDVLGVPIPEDEEEAEEEPAAEEPTDDVEASDEGGSDEEVSVDDIEFE